MLLQKLSLVNINNAHQDGHIKHDHHDDDLLKLHWLDVKKRIVFKILLLSHTLTSHYYFIRVAPTYIQDMFQYTH